MELPELLEMGAVARLVQIENDNHEARTIVITTDTTSRLDVFRRRFWLALDPTINPSRKMSRPTEIMLVARATSTGSGSRPKIKSRRCFARATSSVETRDVISIGSLIIRSANGPLILGSTRRRCVP